MPDALFYGSGTALITPFAGDDIDYGAWERLIECQIEAGTDALVVLGSTGEAPTVTFEERKALIAIAVAISNGRAPVIVGAGSNSTKIAVELVRNARDLGADAALIAAPYYNRPTPAGLKAHFDRIADEAGLPIIAYNVPSRTAVNITPAVMAELARHPQVRGFKEASNDASQIAEVTSALADGIAIYAGNDDQTISVMAQGGRGVITVAGNIAPYEMGALTHAMLREDYETARSIFARLRPLMKALSAETNPGPIKYAMSLRGMCAPGMRLPLCDVSEKTKLAVEAALELPGIG
jgi:4-hydroxy-tetrahydrodipicolinate synthase